MRPGLHIRSFSSPRGEMEVRSMLPIVGLRFGTVSDGVPTLSPKNVRRLCHSECPRLFLLSVRKCSFGLLSFCTGFKIAELKAAALKYTRYLLTQGCCDGGLLSVHSPIPMLLVQVNCDITLGVKYTKCCAMYILPNFAIHSSVHAASTHSNPCLRLWGPCSPEIS